tara:strand:- start:411 stop:1127 length:717 start_codon:yes stop_codon:yes gene_type:complete
MTSETCTLVGNDFSIFVQFFLLFSAIITLVYKRQIENPKRKLLIWFFDTSKQAFSGSLQHLTNMALGLFFGLRKGLASECVWYIVNFAITSFGGLVVIYFVMKLYDFIIQKYNIQILKSGYYGNPPNWKPWLLQLLLWGIISCFEKLFTATVVILPLYDVLDKFGAFIETPFLNYPKIELVLVMLILPTIINCIFFWICDNILKQQLPHGDSSINKECNSIKVNFEHSYSEFNEQPDV